VDLLVSAYVLHGGETLNVATDPCADIQAIMAAKEKFETVYAIDPVPERRGKTQNDNHLVYFAKY
jgi:hypothetical protein